MPAPPEPPRPRPAVTPIRATVGLCLFAPFVAMMWVGSYAKTEPVVAGIPFFYWYQMLWVPVSAALTAIAYRLVRHEQAARRAAARKGEDR